MNESMKKAPTTCHIYKPLKEASKEYAKEKNMSLSTLIGVALSKLIKFGKS